MANFFKSMASDGLSEKGFPNSKASCASLRFNNINTTRNTNIPATTPLDNDPTLSPITKEINNRLKVLNKILPHEEVVQLSQDIINRLNSACYDKIAETVYSNSAAPSIYNGANSVCNSMISQRINSQSRFQNGIRGNKEPVTTTIFKAAKKVRTQLDLGTINEEPQSAGLSVHSSRDKSKLKRQKALAQPAVLSSQNEDDSMYFRKPMVPGYSRGQRLTQKKNNSQTARTGNKKKKIVEDADMSVTSCDLTITRTSLRSNAAGSKKKEVISNKQKTSKTVKQNNLTEELTSSFEDEAEQKIDESQLMQRIQSRPKKTALSPFFGRFKQRCSANTSTPLKL